MRYFSSHISHSLQTNYTPDMKWWGGARSRTRPICLKAGRQDEATPQSYIHILHLRFYTSDGRSIVWPFSSLRLMLVKGEGGHCPPWPAGMFGASESMESRGPAKCQAHMAALT